MIETLQDLRTFLTENSNADWLIHAVPSDDGVHACASRCSVVFIRNISTSKTYYFSVAHPDSIPSVEFKVFVEHLQRVNNRKWALDKKTLEQLLPLTGVLDGNLIGYLRSNTTLDLADYDTIAHDLIRRQNRTQKRINQAIPILKLKEAFDEMADDLVPSIQSHIITPSFQQFNDLIIATLGQIETSGIFVDRDLFKIHFEVDVPDSMVYSQYNVYTATGRPSNRFGGINYAALNQSDGSRACFCSRFGDAGRIVVIDYTAFHPRIICNLTNYPISVDRDIYEYLARLYFQKQDVDETDIYNAKQLTFRQLYGGVEEKYSHIRYLANLKTFIDEQWALFKKYGYVETPIFKRRITEQHVTDPNPAKVFNYILQAAEGEISIPKVKQVLDYLTNTNRKSKAILYTYDSVIYDFHKNDGWETLSEIRKIMSSNGAFPMKTYIGKTYQTVNLMSL